MKKVGLIASLACLFTIGGVYATWTYASGGAAEVTGSLSPEMAGKTETSEKGEIHVDTEDLSIFIDQKASDDYHPVIRLEGHIGVWFVPDAGASEDVKTNGIPLKLTLTQSENWKYDPHELDESIATTQKDIFTVNSNPVVIDLGNPILRSAGDPFPIPASVIEDLIELKVQEEIDTVDEWTYFDNLLRITHSDKQFTVTISEYTGS